MQLCGQGRSTCLGVRAVLTWQPKYLSIGLPLLLSELRTRLG